MCEAGYRLKIVSIHAPAWGATVFLPTIVLFVLFQSTLPHGERLFLSNLLNLKRLFPVFCETVFLDVSHIRLSKNIIENIFIYNMLHSMRTPLAIYALKQSPCGCDIGYSHLLASGSQTIFKQSTALLGRLPF